MVPHRRVNEPIKSGRSTRVHNCIIAPRDWVRDHPSDLIQRDVIDAEAPNEIVNIINVFLVGLGGQKALKEPLPVVYLVDVSHFFECTDARSHFREFTGAVIDLLNRDRSCCPSIDDTFVIFDRNEVSRFVENCPIFCNECNESMLCRRVEMADIEVF